MWLYFEILVSYISASRYLYIGRSPVYQCFHVLLKKYVLNQAQTTRTNHFEVLGSNTCPNKQPGLLSNTYSYYCIYSIFIAIPCLCPSHFKKITKLHQYGFTRTSVNVIQYNTMLSPVFQLNKQCKATCYIINKLTGIITLADKHDTLFSAFAYIICHVSN